MQTVTRPPADPLQKLARMRLLLTAALLSLGCAPAARPPMTPVPPARIVSLAPALTEAVFALGASDRLVGVTTECDYPPGAKAIAKVGGFGPRELGAEGVLAARPDLVLTMASFHKGVTDQVAGAGVRVLEYDPKTLGEVAAMLRDIGAATGRAAEGDRLAAAIEAEVSRPAAPPAGARPKVLIVVGTDPLYCAGPGTLLGQMVQLSGGDNVLDATLGDYPRLSDEAILGRAPDVILLPDSMGVAPAAALAERPGWAGLPAVQSGRVVALPGDVVSRPGPRVSEGLAAVRAALGVR